jgi:DNA-binding CsgD family transcriptional regulator
MSDEQAIPPTRRVGHAQTLDLFPVRLLGFGLFMAWAALTTPLEQNLDIAYLSSPLARLFLLSAICALGYIVIAWFVHATGRNLWTNKVLIACCTCCAAFPLLEHAAIFTSLFAFDLCAIVVHSLGSVGLFLMWNVQIAAHRPKTAWTAYAGSMALASCVYFLVGALGDTVLLIALLALPALSGILLSLSARLPKDGTDDAEEETEWKIPWRPIIMILVFAFAFGFVAHYEGNARVPVQLGRLVASGIILACVTALFSRFEENTIAKVSSICMIAALLLCGTEGFNDAFGLGKLLASIAYYAFMLYVFFALSMICFKYKARVEWLFGIVQAVYVIMTAPSALFGAWVKDASAYVAFPLVDTAVNATVVLMAGLSMFLLMSGTFTSTWGIKALRKVSNDEGVQVEQPIARDYLKDRVYCCAMIARQYGLTHREEEVLSLLVDNKSFVEIESALYIAHGTLRVHVQHLYAKLDAHSSEEVCRFFDAWCQELRRN